MAIETRECSVTDCGKPLCARGYCSAHYRRFLRHGDPVAGRAPNGGPIRFIHEVALSHVGNGCLIWPFGKNAYGYAQVRADGNMAIASRYVCELAHGAPPTPEHEAAHSCGKGREGCIAPGHLDWKTSAENKADMLAHGTHNRGERNYGAKLTEANVREIIDRKGIESLGRLAARFGVVRQTISLIHSGKNWGWLQ